MFDPTSWSRPAPSALPSARGLRNRPRVEAAPATGFPWFETIIPIVIDGEVLAGPGSEIPRQRREPGE